jgi:hypothetical protein
MSSQSLPPPRRRPYGWWIGGALFAALIALVAAAVVHFSEPIGFVYGFMSGNPSVPNCTTAITREEVADRLWYRIVEIDCPGDSLHIVYARSASSSGFLLFPAFMSIGTPLPVSVRATGDNGFEIVLAEPLAEGRAALPIEFDQFGFVRLQSFDHRRPKDFTPWGHG